MHDGAPAVLLRMGRRYSAILSEPLGAFSHALLFCVYLLVHSHHFV